MTTRSDGDVRRRSRTTDRRNGLVLGVVVAASAVVGSVAPGAGQGRGDAAPRGEELVAQPLAAGEVLRVPVPGAEGGKTVIGQLTVAQATAAGYVTAYGCDRGVPRSPDGLVDRSDLNFDGRIAPNWSNRLIVEADDDGEICLYTVSPVHMIVDVNAVSFDTGISSFPNRRTDTRLGPGPIGAGGVIRVDVPEAAGAQTVIGQLTAARATGPGFVTAFGCAEGLPRNARGDVSRSDLNYDGRVTPAQSNRLIVEADDDGDVCFYTSGQVDLVVDVNGVADVGIVPFPNRRTDTRSGTGPVDAGGVLRVNVPEAAGAKTVIGQLTATGVSEPGYVTAYGCDHGLPRDGTGAVARSDLNYDRRIASARSNRLIVEADDDGDVCFYTLDRVDLVVDVNGVSGIGITSFENRRTDTRSGTTPSSRDRPIDADGVPVWPPYAVLPPLSGVAALTGAPADATVTSRPIIAAKVDNYRLARPHVGLDRADAVIEVNVEGVSRFIALFHSRVPPSIGPVRSARTTDLDLLAAMNRPAFGYSGANPGVNAWIQSAAKSNLLVDLSAQHSGCYRRDPNRPGPHNLILDSACFLAAATTAGPARPLWAIDPTWTPSGIASTPDSTFQVVMDGVFVQWTWDAATRTYLRSQDGAPHVTETGNRLAASTVVELATDYVPSPVDSRSPHAHTLGSGNALVHRDGRAISAIWSREQPTDPFTFIDATTRSPLPLDAGVTYLEFVRDD